jgi:hypothetical protein
MLLRTYLYLPMVSGFSQATHKYDNSLPLIHMAFTKPFPKRSDKSIYPQWEDVELSEEEEQKVEQKAREENNKLMAQCIEDAQNIFVLKGLKGYETSMTEIACALFEKRASHVAYWKEERAREKFLEENK